jgi:hypothetical protein
MANIGAATLHQIMPQKNCLLQNFHPALIHGQSMEGTEDNPRPCRAGIRWCGATDEGLLDVRGMINLWGSKREREHFAQLATCHPNVTLLRDPTQAFHGPQDSTMGRRLKLSSFGKLSGLSQRMHQDMKDTAPGTEAGASLVSWLVSFAG